MTIRIKQILSFCLLFVSVLPQHAYAYNDMRSSVHWPANGDKVTKTHYEFVDMPTDSTIWDFSHVIETGENHDMQWLNLGDSILVRIEQGSQSTYCYRNDTIIMNSFENALFGMRNNIAPVVLHAGFPCIGDSVISHFNFSGKYCGNNAVDFYGLHILKNIASGTLILPNDTLTNIIRIRQTINGILTVSPHAFLFNNSENKHDLKTLQHTITTDRWYSPHFKYELAENTISTYSCEGNILQRSLSTFLCCPDAQIYSLGTYNSRSHPRNNLPTNGDTHTSGHSLSPIENIFFSIGNNDINITFNNLHSLNSDVKTSLILSDQLGRIWSSHHIDLSTSQQYQSSIPISGLPSGNYILYISLGNEIKTFKFQIKQ
ncbi:MAG: T9SS type A sorting domain-containing protein [Muribaculaceae bacterium]|nr:T9SS type A sorting domain-containing protein [Muribaculaceae bacterium]